MIEANLVKTEVECSFPLLAENTNESVKGLIVLFTGPTTGTVVVPPVDENYALHKTYKVGFHCNSWNAVTLLSSGVWRILPPGTKIELMVK